MQRIVTAALVTIALTACAPDKPPEKTVFDPQVEALKKARQVEAQAQQNADAQRRATEAAEGGAVPTQQGY